MGCAGADNERREPITVAGNPKGRLGRWVTTSIESHHPLRESVRRCPAGSWDGRVEFDIPGGEVVTLCAKVTIDREAGEVLIDFAGSSAQSPKGVNVVLNYTRAYSTFAIRSILKETMTDLPSWWR